MGTAPYFKPLQGVRVVEFGNGYVAPVAAMYLAQLGADVIKVENRHTHDFMRGDIRNGPGLSPSFIDANRGKRSVCIDAKSGKGAELVRQLVAQADVLIENMSAGAMSRLGLSYEAVRTVRPDIIMLSLQGMGADVAHSITLGQNLPPLIGLTYLWNHLGAKKPVGSQIFHPDYYAGVFSAVLALAALDHRRRTGQGHFIDAAQAEVAASLLGPWYIASTVNSEAPQPLGNKGSRGAPAGCYPCEGADEWCVIVVHNDQEWAGLKRVVSGADWVNDPRFGSVLTRIRNRTELDQRLAAWTSRHPAQEVMERMQAEGVPCGVAQTVAAMVEDRNLLHQGFIQQLLQPAVGPILVGGSPIAVANARIDDTLTCPRFGEHSAQVLQDWIDVSPDQIRGLEAEGVIG